MGNSVSRRIFGGIEKFFRGVVSGVAAGGIGAAIGSIFGPVGMAVGAITGVISSAAVSTRNIVHYINSDEEPTAGQIISNLGGDIKNTIGVFEGNIGGAVGSFASDLQSGMSIRGAQLNNGISHVPRAIENGAIRGLANRNLVNGTNPFTALAVGNGAFRSSLGSIGKSSYHHSGIEQHIYGSALGLMSSQANASTQPPASASGYTTSASGASGAYNAYSS
jgi:hypothetical protein